MVKQKRKGRKMCQQIDQEFLQGKIKSLSYNPNIETFSTYLRSIKPLAVEEKIKRIKKERLYQTKFIKKDFIKS